MRKKHSNIFKINLIIVEVIYFIAAIIAGFATSGKHTFNWTVALAVWASNFVIWLILYAVYSILDHQETQISILDKISEQLNSPNDNQTSNLEQIAANIKKQNNIWICPKCGDKNSNTNLQCSCGYVKSNSKPMENVSFKHLCPNCAKEFTVTYKNVKGQALPVLKVTCPHCKTELTIKK
mgnify:CR=1 FL=1|jgi:transposase-like protein|nr:MAG TPA_asm: Protein involved in formate dehydrogenase formation [Caudoviricetes sp.]